jgi:hypothetical protein
VIYEEALKKKSSGEEECYIRGKYG